MIDAPRQRFAAKVPLNTADGSSAFISTDLQNELQAGVIKEFGPRFAPGASVLYVAGGALKNAVIDAPQLPKLNIPVTERAKLPDIILYSTVRNWLFLIEAVLIETDTSHGPISPSRLYDIEDTLKGCPAGRVYVTAFPTMQSFKRHAGNIAWETEVWIAESADHMIHFNGRNFLGPYVKSVEVPGS